MSQRERLLFVSSSGADKFSPMLEALQSVEDLDVEAVHYGTKHRFFDSSLIGLVGRAVSRVQQIAKDVRYNRNVARAVNEFRPDYLFVVKGLRIYPRTLRVLTASHPQLFLINWSQDDMYAPHNRNGFYTRGLRSYDLVVTQKSYNARPEELPSLGARNILLQDKAFLPRVHRIYAPGECTAPTHDVVFVGTAERDRFDKMNTAAKAGIQIHVYGARWDAPWVAANAHPNLKIHHEVLLGSRYAATISRSKISLGFLRKESRDLQTSRTVEIPACGGFMLTEDTEEQRRLFEADREAVFFSNADTMVLLIKKYLADEAARRSIAEAGYARSRQSNYTYQARAKEIILTARRLRDQTPNVRSVIAAPSSIGVNARAIGIGS